MRAARPADRPDAPAAASDALVGLSLDLVRRMRREGRTTVDQGRVSHIVTDRH